ncbi:hypothetical protein A1O7_05951 [Cladophialophora yegresii CBS 114405]|uniref:ubiquitinyl hydrolase 1 n=1 Tax=Cladophialophora yegresii CBS 114405 TaxID=1182544 RepID=W9W0M7_9EURO|nr:uncharacterized protein A1O7_05951 [Cladophialophora yegresii CBS 114405]EXJ58525.1 hypothetical protein A1O7_05951 [Cladophialophora yegresii CBS 114405]
MAAADAAFLRAVATHMILPPDLPGGVDRNLPEIDGDLLRRAQDACTELKATIHSEFQRELSLLESSLDYCYFTHSSAHLDSLQLQRAFRRLQEGEILIIHVHEQNAGLLVRHGARDLKGHVIFEAFEVSAQSEKVLECKGALQWTFPTSAAAIPNIVFADEHFQQQLADFLERGSMENIKKFGAVTHKAQSLAFEPRDTSDPALITGLLITILVGIGQLVSVPPITKRVKDEVRFKDALIPWRRSPFWLLLRVGILRHLEELTGPTVANTLYKALMCLMQARLLIQMIGSQTPDLSHLLFRKLCRRMAKLEKDRVLISRANANTSRLHGIVLNSIRPALLQATKDANVALQNAWESYKSKIQRRITPFKTRTARPEHLRLGLRNSAPYLGQMQQHPLVVNVPRGTYIMSPALRQFFGAYSDLAHTEEDILAQHQQLASFNDETCSDSVLTLAEDIHSYLSKSSDQCYEVGTVDRSRMILATMWLWVLMDRLCCRFILGYSRYKPVFHPLVLDCLLLSSYADLCRLHEIQCYLTQRHATADATGPPQTIFDTPMYGCFADCYFQSLDSGSDIHLLNQTMQEAEQRRKHYKETEWAERDAEHQQITKELSAITCQYTFVGDLLLPEHDQYKCTKCILTKKADSIGIERIEQALPYNSGEARAALLELRCPKAFSACRNATWAIAANLGLPNVQETRKEPLTIVHSYYAEFSRERAPRRTGVTLASRTKSFLQTHFRYVRFPIPLEKVRVNNGLRFEYYDLTRKLWPVEHLHEITFGHHCWVPIPRRSPFAQIDYPSRVLPNNGQSGNNQASSAHPAMSNATKYLVANSAISSNEVLAGLPRCPQTLGAPEFVAFQGLLSDSQRLWPAILVELGSSNLNFSSAAVASLLQALSYRTGRPCENTFHTTNVVFRSESFCNDLLSQIERRLSSISSNWRESSCMEVLLSLIFKVVELGSETVCLQATQLVENVRNITLNWIKLIREELWGTVNAVAAAGLTHSIVWAALLCRRTFTICDNSHEPRSCSAFTTDASVQSGQRSLASSALVIFMEASIALQENLVEDLTKLLPSLRSALARDVKMVCGLQSRLTRFLGENPHSLVAAAVSARAISGEALSSRPTSVSFNERHDGVWAEIRLPSKSNFDAPVIEYHLVGGVLLLDGRAVERELPVQIRHADAIARLFPNQRLVVYRSSLPGMTYKVAFDVEGQEVHFGFRGGELVIRLWGQNGSWEYLPPSIFEHNDTFDLPASLIDGCVHWLDLDSNIIEVRRAPKVWRSAPGNWNINLHTGMANRRQSTLLDPGSNLFLHFASVFRGFEDPRHITVYQPARWPLAVELRRYELTFFVNQRGFLECQQLRAEVDENQDAGTWYGLSSKIVLRDVQNPCERSIIVPLAPLTVRRKGMHVDVQVQRVDPVVGRFFLDDVLGRVTCASEPRLFYTKALLHASTSFCLPDPLTGRTGADEACRILQAGACQPYAPLNAANEMLIASIADLTPKRQFYPEDLRVMETVSWRKDLTVATQDDRYWQLVNVIKQKSDLLAQFKLKEDVALEAEQSSMLMESAIVNDTNTDLVLRGQMRRLPYQRPDLAVAISTVIQGSGDILYCPRGYHDYQKSQDHVFEAASLLKNWPSKLPSPSLLHVMMQQWPHIAGYGDGMVVYDKIRLSDRLDADIASSWGPLVNLCRLSSQDTKYKLLFLLATISFREEVDVHAIHTLIAFSVFPDLKKIDLPSWPSYTQFRPGYTPKTHYLKQLLGSSVLPFATSGSQISMTQKERKALDAARRAHEVKAVQDLDSLVNFMCAQWPCALPDLKQFSTSTLDTDAARSAIAMEWHAMFQNHEFEEHLRQVQDVLDRHRTSPPVRTPKKSVASLSGAPSRGFPSIQLDLLNKEGPLTSLHAHQRSSGLSCFAAVNPLESNRDIKELRRIVTELPTSKSIVRQEYIQGLLHSITALEGSRLRSESQQSFLDFGQLENLIARAQDTVDFQKRRLVVATKKDEPGATWLDAAGLWPITSSVDMLEALRSTSHIPMTASVRRAITTLGVMVTHLQRLRRIQDASWRGKTQQLDDELKNHGHTNWDPEKYPDWLLLEIDTNILIRPVQADVAFQVISPASGSNSVLQLNMGQGKTSTIIPLVASVLADGHSLCRVVVPKALLLQTAQLLQSRLGGLLGRELCHVPFSRRTPCTLDHLQAYARIHRSTLKSSGVIIALPEHLMSFMLSGQQRLLDGKFDEATRMIKLHHWLSGVSRDVFDESDFTMAVKTQLIYPSGPQVTVNGGNYRWETIQTVLRLVFSHLDVLERSYESSIQVVRRQVGGFPFIYFLRPDVQQALMQLIVADICSGRTPLLNIDNFSALERQAIRAFITEANPQHPVVKCVSEIHKNSSGDGYVIYLLRGLLVHRILILTLSRRWNVQYGLHPLRDPVSVPFLGKGVASNLAEWGHVDVSLLFTCLSFYYQGLAPAQLKQSLERILKSDDPAREYEQWTQGSSGLSDRHRDWTSINLEDTTQLTEIWSAVRFNLTAIDHFLNNFVFPKHAKQFKVKLQASGWDLPLAGHGSSLTTGFSGTNDNRLVLPLNIKQDDLKGLAHTNAEVLCYLLHDRNRAYALAGFRDDLGGRAVYRRMSEPDFLRKLRRKGIRILIDAGALILEMTNFTLAKMWLEIDTEASAAVFFDENNKPTVLTRSGRKTPLVASPYAEDLSTCLVYLDESHTRGTDMKFPPLARGAVTLSLGQTKDHTMQAVMRLRRLATTQSITFFAPPEVHQSILDFRCKGDNRHLDSHDVVCWLLEQTCQGLENLQPLFHAQGVNYCQRTQAASNNPQYLSNPAQRDAYLGALQDHEQQSLKSLYEPRTEKKKKNRIKDEKFEGKIGLHIRELERRRKAFQDTGSAVHASALQEVEQEREVAVEAETIRERQKPVYFHPHTFSGLAHALKEFILSGILRLDNSLWESAFSYMKRSATALKYPAELPASPQLLVSAEFRQAVIVPSGKVNDDFLRPVQWILWSMNTETAILVSPEEAEELIPLCREAPKQVVHLLSYASPVTQKMLQFNSLDYYAVPPLPLGWSAPMWLRIQVGIFAGRLYFPFEELAHIRSFLGLGNDDASNLQTDLAIEIEGERVEGSSGSDDHQSCTHNGEQVAREEQAITKEARTAKLKATRMLTFLHAWLGMRGRGQDFTHTPMGYICARKTLTEDHPFFRKVDDDESRRSRVQHAMAGDTSVLAHMVVERDEDGHSDVDEEELDTRHRLTEEELRLSANDEGSGGEDGEEEKCQNISSGSKG